MPDRGYFGVSKCIQNNNQVHMTIAGAGFGLLR